MIILYIYIYIYIYRIIYSIYSIRMYMSSARIVIWAKSSLYLEYSAVRCLVHSPGPISFLPWPTWLLRDA